MHLRFTVSLFTLGWITSLATGTPVDTNPQTQYFSARSPSPQATTYTAYLFAYFTGEGLSNGETVSFAVSDGDDPLHWKTVNGGNPYLTSTLGTKGIRDPSIIRSQDGSKFYLLATDLKIYGNGNWDAAQRTGSRSIVIYESTDLKNWGTERLVQVSPVTAGNTWAPDAIWDPKISAYVVFWASQIFAANDTAHTGTSYERQLYATTTDFNTFSAAQIYVDYGYHTIDATIILDSVTSNYYRFLVNGLARSSSNPNGMYVFQETATDILGTWTYVAGGLGKGTISGGEGPTVFKSNTVANKYHLFMDENTGRGYVPFESTDISSGVWTPSSNYSLPANPRHGSVIPITAAEAANVLSI